MPKGEVFEEGVRTVTEASLAMMAHLGARTMVEADETFARIKAARRECLGLQEKAGDTHYDLMAREMASRISGLAANTDEVFRMM
jgi:hypothetical protein